MPILGVLASGISGNLTATSGYVAIASYTYSSSSSASVTFSDIPTIYEHLELRWSMGDTTTNNNTFWSVRFNGDTSTSNYGGARGNANRSASGTNLQNFTAWSNLGYIQVGYNTQDKPSSDLKFPSVGIAKIPVYSNADLSVDGKRKNVSSWYYTQTADNDYYLGRGWGTWGSTAKITSITFFSTDSRTLTIGSTVSLYGVK